MRKRTNHNHIIQTDAAGKGGGDYRPSSCFQKIAERVVERCDKIIKRIEEVKI